MDQEVGASSPEATTGLVGQAPSPDGLGHSATIPCEFGPWIVWSNEHRAFWASNRQGYTGAIEKAGRYSRHDAEMICRYASPRANSTINVGTPPEICMPAPEAGDLLAELLETLMELRDHVVTHACVWDDAESGSHHHPIWLKVSAAISKATGES